MLSITVHGIKVAYERRGQGRPLVLLHGYPLDHTIWEPLLPFLEADFDLILPDLRGFGQSSVVQTPYLLTDMASDIAALMDALSLRQAILVGHSMGGYIALAFAASYPERLLGLGLVASQAAADTPERKAARYALAERVAQNGLGEVAEVMPAALTPIAPLQESLRTLILRQSSWGVIGALRAMAERPDSTPLLSHLQVPLVIVHGLADSLVPVERARQVASLAPKARLFELTGVAHMPMWEAPQATAEALRTFLEI
ncbi:MAG: alpha/beta hydrolase [Anaerolineales bacterium]|nr:alpha/beta hydrolase [Anaerolineales bacterium]